jgi:hypothetical protein
MESKSVNVKKFMENYIPGWLPSEPRNYCSVSVLKKSNSHGYRNFRVKSRLAILAVALPLLALANLANLNSSVRLVLCLTILSSGYVLSVMADRYAKRKYVEPSPNVRNKW